MMAFPQIYHTSRKFHAHCSATRVDLKPRLIEPDQQRIKQLIEELEVILLQLANYEEQKDLPAIELVKKC